MTAFSAITKISVCITDVSLDIKKGQQYDAHEFYLALLASFEGKVDSRLVLEHITIIT